MRFLTAFFAALAFLNVGPVAFAVEDATPVVDAPAKAPDPVAELKAALPDTPAVVERDGGLWWQVGGIGGLKLVGHADGNPQVETEVGLVAVTRKLLADGRSEPLAALPGLVARAKADGVTGGDAVLTLAEGVMTGFHLKVGDLAKPDAVVLPEATLKKSDVPEADRGAEIERVRAGAEALAAALASSGLDPLAIKAVGDVLGRLSQADTFRKYEPDEVWPSFARRVIRHGWLDALGSDAAVIAAATELEAAVAAAETAQPTTLFAGAGGARLAEVKDAFKRGGWILTTPTRAAYTRPLPQPMYLWGGNANLSLVTQLKPGADPLAGASDAAAVKLFQGATPIAWWSAESGFAHDEAAWRKALPERPAASEGGLVSGFLPPHVLLVDLDGDVRRLITAHGAVETLADGAAAASSQFIAQAAKALPDAAHLDLVGEYLFYYVYDSPDSRSPLVIGNKLTKGDIHQTCEQTLSTACGGMLRGDCDDLSELYQGIAEAQGRTAHIITLPSHAAVAFAEQDDEQQWHVFVLQTGQPLEFVDATLPGALTKTYSSFDEADTFDPNGLGLLLRFSGENTRSSWRLSWRIFAEPAYAQTMIDVQKDWHYQTYQRGIAKMLKLIADGDDDTANYRELSGLYSFTGQYAKSADYHQQAIDRTPDAESKLYSSVELVQHLFDADDAAKAREVASDILDQQLPALSGGLGPRALQLGMQLANTLVHGEAWDLALRALDDTATQQMTEQITQVAGWLDSNRFNPRQWESAIPLRRMQQEFVGTAIQIIDGMGTDALPENESLRNLVGAVQQWLSKIAFRDIDEPEDNLVRYASAGAFYAAILGSDELNAMLEPVALPTSVERDHAARVDGLAQVRLDLPWIKLSVPYWTIQLTGKFDRGEKELDLPQALKLGARLAEADAACRALGWENPFMNHQAHIGALITALIGEDEASVRRLLTLVKEKNDKRLRDDTAQWLGDVARFTADAWYPRVIGLWEEIVDYKPKWYWIAWRAALNHAPHKALMVAERAAKRFADDPAFTEEYQFMKLVFAETADEPKADTPIEVA
ncbi:MAG: hypothetical protein H0X45_03530, partial [Planctomycetes bacterium]|nr:hypothetical protein [Planctomycetota bacterium]